MRDRLKPGWRSMLDPEVASAPPSERVVAQRASSAATALAEATALIAASVPPGGPTSGLRGRVLEIGCYDGAAAFQLVLSGARDVVASDLARYYVTQRPGDDPGEADVADQQVVLAELRERARLVAGVEPGRVTFVEDDITDSRLDAGSFDAILSFEVLEHLQRPGAAFGAMARLLKPGALAYHVYNPFFSANGGHSLCTLDFPWGHARLEPADFERYVRQIRPSEADQALRFYRESLNRMTLADLHRAVDDAGLELLAVIPWTDRTLASTLNSDIPAEVRRTYPGATPQDLLATFVSVVLARPGGSARP